MNVLGGVQHCQTYSGWFATRRSQVRVHNLNPPISALANTPQTTNLCPCCGGRMIIIERFERGATPRYRPTPTTPAVRIDTS
jgi:hypothetical protein